MGWDSPGGRRGHGYRVGSDGHERLPLPATATCLRAPGTRDEAERDAADGRMDSPRDRHTEGSYLSGGKSPGSQPLPARHHGGRGRLGRGEGNPTRRGRAGRRRRAGCCLSPSHQRHENSPANRHHCRLPDKLLLPRLALGNLALLLPPSMKFCSGERARWGPPPKPPGQQVGVPARAGRSWQSPAQQRVRPASAVWREPEHGQCSSGGGCRRRNLTSSKTAIKHLSLGALARLFLSATAFPAYF